MSSTNTQPSFRVPARFYAIVAVALGMILLATAALALFGEYRSSRQDQPTDFSSIPASVDLAAPELSLRDLAGQQHTLADYRGSIVLVNLWATWCPPCQAEMPNLERFYRQHQNAGLVVLGINDGDPSEEVRSFMSRYALSFPVWLDPTYQATDQAFKTANLPTSYVIDRSGRIKLMWVGAISEDNLEKYVTPLIQE